LCSPPSRPRRSRGVGEQFDASRDGARSHGAAEELAAEKPAAKEPAAEEPAAEEPAATEEAGALAVLPTFAPIRVFGKKGFDV